MSTRHPPVLVVIAAGLVLGQSIVTFIGDSSLIRASAVVVAAVLARLLLAGSRIGWSLVLIGALVEVRSALVEGDHASSLVVGGTIVGSIVLSPSIRFVWSERASKLPSASLAGSRRKRINDFGYKMLARLAAWEVQENKRDERRNYSELLWRLAIGMLILVVLVGATYQWQRSSGRNEALVDVIVRVTWSIWAVVTLAVIVVALIAIYQRFLRSDQPRLHRDQKP